MSPSELDAPPATTTAVDLLRIEDLHVAYRGDVDGATVRALNGIDLTLRSGQALGVLGESGCGKSTLARCILGGIDRVPGVETTGRVVYQGRDLFAMDEKERRRLRGREIAIIPQDSLAALNPVKPIGDQIAELFTYHEGMSSRAATDRAVTLLRAVGIQDAPRRAKSYAHELSGGMRQRVTIAMAIALNPRVLIADEPTTALDVTVQAEILDLLRNLIEEHDISMVFITHDLPVLTEVVEEVIVMYAGRVVDSGPLTEVLTAPAHPYTLGLINSVPRGAAASASLLPIRGRPPDLQALFPGCSFAPRCDLAIEKCWMSPPPPLEMVSAKHASACHRSGDVSRSVSAPP